MIILKYTIFHLFKIKQAFDLGAYLIKEVQESTKITQVLHTIININNIKYI